MIYQHFQVFAGWLLGCLLEGVEVTLASPEIRFEQFFQFVDHLNWRPGHNEIE